MNLLNWWDFPRKAWILILGEFMTITILSSWLYVDYLNNPFMQVYVSNLLPVIVPVLSVTFGAVAAMVATMFYLGVRKIRLEQEKTESPRMTQMRKAARKRTLARQHASTPVRHREEVHPNIPKPKFIITSAKPQPTQEKTSSNNEKNSGHDVKGESK